MDKASEAIFALKPVTFRYKDKLDAKGIPQFGYQALFAVTTGASNTGIGRQALLSNITGSNNTAIGRDALADNTTGSNNIAVGIGAGVSLATGDNNIDIGNAGGGSESDTIRIGDSQTRAFILGITGVPVTGTAVVVNLRSTGRGAILTAFQGRHQTDR